MLWTTLQPLIAAVQEMGKCVKVSTEPAHKHFKASQGYKPCDDFKTHHCMANGTDQKALEHISDACIRYDEQCACNGMQSLAAMSDPTYEEATTTCCTKFQELKQNEMFKEAAKPIYQECVKTMEGLVANLTMASASCETSGSPFPGDEKTLVFGEAMYDLLTGDLDSLQSQFAQKFSIGGLPPSTIRYLAPIQNTAALFTPITFLGMIMFVVLGLRFGRRSQAARRQYDNDETALLKAEIDA